MYRETFTQNFVDFESVNTGAIEQAVLVAKWNLTLQFILSVLLGSAASIGLYPEWKIRRHTYINYVHYFEALKIKAMDPKYQPFL